MRLAKRLLRRMLFVVGLVFGLGGLFLSGMAQHATAYQPPTTATSAPTPTAHPPIRVAGREKMRLGYGQAYAMAWSPDGTRVAVGGSDGVWIFSDTLTPIKHLTEQRADTVTWSSDGESIGITLDVPYYDYVEMHLRDQSDLGAALYDADTGDVRMAFPRLQTPGAWSPDGEQYAYASRDGTIHVCSVPEDWCEPRYRGHVNTSTAEERASSFYAVHSIHWTPDGKRIHSEGHVWDVATGQKQFNLGADPTAAWSADGRLVAVGQYSGLDIYDAQTGLGIGTIPFGPGDGSGEGKAWNDEGTRLAVATEYGELLLYDADLTLLRRLNTPDRDITPIGPDRHNAILYDDDLTVAWHRDNRRVLVSTSGSLRLWDTVEGTLVASRMEYMSCTNDMAWSATGELATANGCWNNRGDARLRIWDVARNQVRCVGYGHSYYLALVRWRPDGQMLLTGGGSDHTFDDRRARIWDAESCQATEVYTFPEWSAVTSGEWSPDGSRFLIMNELRDAASQQLLATLSEGVRVSAWKADRTAFATSNGGPIHLWRARDGAHTRMFAQDEGTINALVWNPDGRFLVTGHANSVIRIWDIEQGTHERLIEHLQPVYALAFSPDGQLLASAGGDYLGYYHTGENYDSAIRLWDVEQRTVVGTLVGHTQVVDSLAWSPDGGLLASASSDEAVVRIWEIVRR